VNLDVIRRNTVLRCRMRDVKEADAPDGRQNGMRQTICVDSRKAKASNNSVPHLLEFCAEGWVTYTVRCGNFGNHGFGRVIGIGQHQVKVLVIFKSVPEEKRFDPVGSDLDWPEAGVAVVAETCLTWCIERSKFTDRG
jgi:hypothetical protein